MIVNLFSYFLRFLDCSSNHKVVTLICQMKRGVVTSMSMGVLVYSTWRFSITVAALAMVKYENSTIIAIRVPKPIALYFFHS